MSQSLVKKVKDFSTSMPHLHGEYRSRLWGHKLHSLCSYQGKLKPSLSHMLVRHFVNEGDVVLDPLGGVGTIPFEAALAGNRSISNDISPLAAIVAAGKLNPLSATAAVAAVDALEIRMKEIELSPADFNSANFGLNSSVADYFHPETLADVLRARKVLAEDGWTENAFVWASLLHILHGNRPYALSRTSHPITPLAPKGEFVRHSLLEKLRKRVEVTSALDLGSNFKPGRSIYGNFLELTDSPTIANAIITSPPFIGMRFDRSNWPRLWFCGWEERDFHTRSLTSLDRRQAKNRNCYTEFFDMCESRLAVGGTLIIHVGSGGRGDLPGELRLMGSERFDLAGEVIEDSSKYQAHGLSDKGLTKQHHLLFFSR